jgi:aminoglycoside phosphotransferase
MGAKWQSAFAAVERIVGGRVVRAEQQARWRPAAFLDVERDGEIVPVYFRGDRTEGSGVYGLEHEHGVLQVLEAHGIPVPHVYGFCDDPRGIVMARAPGQANLATASSDAERRSVLDHYVAILAEMHRIDAAAFERIGLERPRDAAAIALADLPRWEESFRRRKQRPEPLIELVLAWLRAHLPLHRERVTFVAGDSGQFLFRDGRVTAVIDLELAFLGDPLADLAAMRSRDASEPLGDLSRAFARYAELTAEPLDLGALHFHTARFAINTPLAVAPLCAAPPPGFNVAQYFSWYLVYGRLPLEVIAEVEGIELVAPEVPPADSSRHGPAYDVLVALLRDGEPSYRADTALRIAELARELDRRGDRVEDQDREEAAALLGRRPSDWREADVALEALARTARGRRFADLVRFLYRRSLRQEGLLRPAMRELAGAEFQRIRA